MSARSVTVARNLIAADFAEAFAEDFAEHGSEVIEALRAKDPAAYLRLAAAIEPKDMDGSALNELSDEEIARTLATLDRIRAALAEGRDLADVVEIRVRDG